MIADAAHGASFVASGHGAAQLAQRCEHDRASNSGVAIGMRLSRVMHWLARDIRQRDELRLPRHGGKASVSPVVLGLLEALGGAGDEVPREVARPVHRLAAE